MRILLVDDEEKITRVVKAYLQREGFDVTVVHDGLEALEKLREEEYDFLILDLMLPGLSGEEVCKRVRSSSDVPILMLTAKSSEEDRVEGLSIGADDYLTKPFSPRELVARVRAIMRRVDSQRPRADRMTIGDSLVVDWVRREVTVNGRRVELTPTEFSLLEVLARNSGRPFTRSQLIELALGYDYQGYERTIDAHIKNIRHKLAPADFIVTVYGVGYKLDPERG